MVTEYYHDYVHVCITRGISYRRGMMALNIAQLSYGIPGMLSYFLVFWALFRVRKSLNRSFIVVFTLLAAFVSGLFTFFFTLTGKSRSNEKTNASS